MDKKSDKVNYKSALRWILPLCGLCAIAMLLWQCWVIIRNPSDPEGLKGLVDPLIMVAAFAFIYIKVNAERKQK